MTSMEFLLTTVEIVLVALAIAVLIMSSEIGFLKAQVKNLENDRANREMGKWK